MIGIVTSPAVKLSPNARKRVRDSVGTGAGVGVGLVGVLPPQADSQRHRANRTIVPRRVNPLYFSAAHRTSRSARIASKPKASNLVRESLGPVVMTTAGAVAREG